MHTAWNDTSAMAVANHCACKTATGGQSLAFVLEDGNSLTGRRTHLIVAIAVAHGMGILTLDNRPMLHRNVGK